MLTVRVSNAGVLTVRTSVVVLATPKSAGGTVTVAEPAAAKGPMS